MSYRTILVHADTSPHATQRIAIAAQIAVAFGAHLTGAAMTGISKYVYQEGSVDLARTVIAPRVDELFAKAEQALVAFESIAAAAGVLRIERRLIDDEPQGALAVQARYADLVVVSKTDRSEAAGRLYPELPEYVMLNGARPLLIVPYAGQFNDLGRNVLLAWDESIEAAHAVASALPFLERADKVTIALFNNDETEQREAGADLALYLARHHISVEVRRQQTGIDVGNAILSLAADLDCDLLVMGGFGHSRFREVLLGGVTDTILRSMTVPVLMAH